MNANETARVVVEALEELQVPYMLVGSFSTNAYGIERATKDADFVVELGSTTLSQVARHLGPRFTLDPQMRFETVTGTSRSIMTVEGTPFVVEFFGLGRDPHDRERFARRVRVPLLGGSAWLPTVEDVIITKLRWASIGGRAKDRDDVRDVVAVQQDAICPPMVRGARHPRPAGRDPRLDPADLSR